MVHICIIGAGIQGLSSASHIQDAVPDCKLTIVADKFSPFTTSDIAAGLCCLFQASHHPKFDYWMSKTYNYVTSMAMSEIASQVGAQISYGYRLFDTDERSNIVSAVKILKTLTPEELAIFPESASIKSGIGFLGAILQCDIYLPWLMNKLKSNGAIFIQKHVENISELLESYDIIVNCSGLGSYNLFDDHNLQPSKGIVFKVRAPWLKTFYFRTCEDGTCYVFPSVDIVTVGGVYKMNDWSTTTTDEDLKEIWQRCLKYYPAIKGATIVKTMVGLRPHRPTVRLEKEYFHCNAKVIPVIHNYGHGSSGVSLFKGCAEDVAQLTKECIEEKKLNKAKL